MRWTLLSRSFASAGLVVCVSIAAPPAVAIPVEDIGTHNALLTIVQELQGQTTIMNSQSTTLAEIKATQEDILDAICGRSSLATRIVSAADTDYQNIGSLGLQLVSDELPEGIPSPTFSDVESIEKTARQLYGLARQAQIKAGQVQRTIDRVRNFDPSNVSASQVFRVGKDVLRETRRQRVNVHIDAVESALSFSTYSLADQATSKGREVSLKQARTSAKCLREDIKALTQTNAELTRRLNHLIMLMANDVSMKASTALQGLPLRTVIDEDQSQ